MPQQQLLSSNSENPPKMMSSAQNTSEPSAPPLRLSGLLLYEAILWKVKRSDLSLCCFNLPLALNPTGVWVEMIEQPIPSLPNSPTPSTPPSSACYTLHCSITCKLMWECTFFCLFHNLEATHIAIAHGVVSHSLLHFSHGFPGTVHAHVFFMNMLSLVGKGRG